MKAAVYTRYGSPDVIQIQDIAQPTPRAGEVLVKIHATTVSSADGRTRSLRMPAGFGPMARLMFGVSRPRNPVLGTDLAGEVASVAPDVTSFKKGDRVFGQSGMGFGCHAAYKCMRADAALALIPATVSYEEAAAIPFGGSTALTFLRDKAALRAGENILIIGASGAVGTAAVQLAKHMGAHVTGVCSAANTELVKSIGADHVVDYSRHTPWESDTKYDVILDTVGTASFSTCKRILKAKGRLLLIVASLPQMLSIPWVNLTNPQRVMAGPAAERAEDLRFLAELVRTGAFKPVIDRTLPLERIQEAHALVDSGRKRGNVVVTL